MCEVESKSKSSEEQGGEEEQTEYRMETCIDKQEEEYQCMQHVKHDSEKQPTPWAVTAVAGSIDWSTVPNLGFPLTESTTNLDENNTAHQISFSVNKSTNSNTPKETARPFSEVWRNLQNKKWSFTNTSKVCEKENKRFVIDCKESMRQWKAAGDEHWQARCAKVPLLASASPFLVKRLREESRGWCIPHSLRPVLWLTLTGVAQKIDENEYFCRALLRHYGYVQGSFALSIETDLERTFPHHPYFSSTDVGLYKLKNVLHALCWRNPLQNYCQAFNFLAAFLLLIFDDEERVFWLMVHLLENLLPNDFYDETLTGAKVDEEVMKVVMHDALPAVSSHFDSIHFNIDMLFPSWVLTLFVNTLPIETTLYVWDYILLQGYHPLEQTSAHFEIILAILYMAQNEIILKSTDAHELVVELRKFTSHLCNARQLIETARQHRVSTERIHTLRRQLKPRIVQEIHNMNEERQLRCEERVARELRFQHQQECEQQNGQESWHETSPITSIRNIHHPDNSSSNASKADEIISLSDNGNYSCYVQEEARVSADEWEMMEMQSDNLQLLNQEHNHENEEKLERLKAYKK